MMRGIEYTSRIAKLNISMIRLFVMTLFLISTLCIDTTTSFAFRSETKTFRLSLATQKRMADWFKIVHFVSVVGCLSFPFESTALDLHPSIRINNSSSKNTEIVLTTLADTEAFRSLRIEVPTIRAIRKINALKDLQDSRLEKCVDRGIFWEQCFMFGENDGKKDETNSEMDYQFISPTGALNPGTSAVNKLKTKIPTW